MTWCPLAQCQTTSHLARWIGDRRVGASFVDTPTSDSHPDSALAIELLSASFVP
jgi:hypothetical protein